MEEKENTLLIEEQQIRKEFRERLNPAISILKKLIEKNEKK